MAKGKKESVESNKGETNLAFETDEEISKNVKFKSKESKNDSNQDLQAKDFKRKSSKKKKSSKQSSVIVKVENDEVIEEVEADINKRTSKKKKKSSYEENTNDIIQLEPLENVENEIIVAEPETTTSEKKKSKKKSNKNKQSKLLKDSNSETIIKVSDDLLEVHEPAGFIVKSKSKEDISTLNKNLKEGTPEGKLGKKKKIKQDKIENDLFDEDNTNNSASTKVKSKKKKSKPLNVNNESIELANLNSNNDGNDTNNEDMDDDDDMDENEDEEINVIRDRKRAKKKADLHKDLSRSLDQDILKEESNDQQITGQQKPPQKYKDKVFGVFIHYSECLKLDFFVLHPIVRVSLVDLSTGKFIAKSDRNRKVTSYYEGSHVSNIVPLMSQPYDFKMKRSIVPRWEELLLFNEDPDYLTNFESSFGIFFEIVDFIKMSSVNNESWKTKDPHSTGWHHVAWAFLKPSPSRIHSNIGKTVRLQLYKPQPTKFNSTGDSEVWKWWSQYPHVPYPSSLHVTVEPVNPPQAIQPSIRSMGPLQPEQGSVIVNNQLVSDPSYPGDNSDLQNQKSPPRVVLWTRLPGQTCKIPEQDLYELEMYGKGAWCLRFSHDGKILAVACSDPPSSQGSAIRIYSVETGKLEADLKGHKGPIYALDWHRNNKLLSASGDGSVKIWSSHRQFEASLQHPTYVYAARFHPNSSDTIASAGFDQVVRIWQKSGFLNQSQQQCQYIILHELINHKAYVNCLEFDIDGQVLFSGDQDGTIRVWESSNPESNDNWYLKKNLDFRELQGNAILSLSIHPGGRRLLVHCRSLSTPVIMIDLKLHTIMQTFMGSQSFKNRVNSCITPCGTYVISSSQDGAVYVWNADTGQQAHLYTSPLGDMAAKLGVVVNCVHFSPTDHIIAFSGMFIGQGSLISGQPITAPVFVYKHKANNSSSQKRSNILPSLEVITPSNSTRTDQCHSADLPASSTSAGKEKFKSMLDQLDQMILDKTEEMEN